MRHRQARGELARPGVVAPIAVEAMRPTLAIPPRHGGTWTMRERASVAGDAAADADRRDGDAAMQSEAWWRSVWAEDPR